MIPIITYDIVSGAISAIHPSFNENALTGNSMTINAIVCMLKNHGIPVNKRQIITDNLLSVYSMATNYNDYEMFVAYYVAFRKFYLTKGVAVVDIDNYVISVMRIIKTRLPTITAFVTDIVQMGQ